MVTLYAYSVNLGTEFSSLMYNKYLEIRKMDQQQNTKRQPQIIIKSMQQQIDVLFKSSFDRICKSQKQVCAGLAYCVKYLRCSGVLAEPKWLSLVKQIIKPICTLLQSLQSRQCGHILPLLAFVIKKYIRSVSVLDTLPSSNKDQRRKILNNQSEYYKSLVQNQKFQIQKTILKSKKINQIIVDLSIDNLVTQNTQCLCCSRVFILNLSIQNSNPMIPVTLLLDFHQAYKKQVLEKYVNAVCNSGGGGIVIGVKKTKGSNRVTGRKFVNQEGIIYKQNQIILAIERTKIKCRYSIQRVLVHSGYQTTSPKQAGQQYMRVCFRILIFPVNNLLNYMHIENQTKRQAYYLDNSQEIKSIQKIQAYNKIHELYRKRRQKIQNAHQNILCCKVYAYYSKRFYDYYNDGLLHYQNLAFNDADSDSEDSLSDIEDIHQIEKWDKSLVIAGSQNYDKHVDRLSKYLSQNGQKVILDKPFRTQFTNCVRSVWKLNHQSSHQKIKNMFKRFAQKNNLRQQIITLMPIYPILQIQSPKFTEFIESNLVTQLKQYFKHGDHYNYSKSLIQISDPKHQSTKKLTYLLFNNIKQSLFAYMFFEELNYRPYFLSYQNCKKYISS